MPGLEERLVVLSPHLHDGVALSVAARRAGVSVADGPPVVGVYRADGSAGLSRSGRADDGDWRIAARVGGIGEGVGAAASVAEDRRGPPQDLRGCRGAGSAGTVVSVVSVVSVGSAGSSGAWIVACWQWRITTRMCTATTSTGVAPESLHANAIRHADHTLLDVMVVDASGTAVRPWLTVILDE